MLRKKGDEVKVRIVKVEGKELTIEVLTTKTIKFTPKMDKFNLPELASQISTKVIGKRDTLGNNHPHLQKRYKIKYPYSLKQTRGLWVIMDAKIFVKRYSDDPVSWLLFEIRRKIDKLFYGKSDRDCYVGSYEGD